MTEPSNESGYDLTTPVVVRFRDGRMLKCRARKQFSVALRSFQLIRGDQVESVPFDELKAVFFVRALEGIPGHRPTNEETPASPKAGRLVSVRFYDGEEISGRCLSYSAEAPGFFVYPLDAEGNNERVFVIASATATVAFREDPS
jgi:hypothetical protein